MIHDWDDDRARTLLGRCRQAMPEHAGLLLVEPVLPDEDGPAARLSAVLSDLNMPVMVGGRERTRTQYTRLLAPAGLDLVRVSDPLAPTHFQVLEAVPHWSSCRPGAPGVLRGAFLLCRPLGRRTDRGRGR